MMIDGLHPLLKRQLEKLNIEDLPDKQTWHLLLERISHTYTEAEQDRYRLERSLTVNSEEMQAEIVERKRAEASLKETLGILADRNHQLKRAIAFFHSTMEHLLLTLEHGASREELLEYIRIVQIEFEHVNRPTSGQ
jgi:hypothetical protein